jgi:hypothetical protein
MARDALEVGREFCDKVACTGCVYCLSKKGDAGWSVCVGECACNLCSTSAIFEHKGGERESERSRERERESRESERESDLHVACLGVVLVSACYACRLQGLGFRA